MEVNSIPKVKVHLKQYTVVYVRVLNSRVFTCKTGDTGSLTYDLHSVDHYKKSLNLLTKTKTGVSQRHI